MIKYEKEMEKNILATFALVEFTLKEIKKYGLDIEDLPIYMQFILFEANNVIEIGLTGLEESMKIVYQ